MRDVHTIVREYRQGLRKIFGDRLVDVRLYGSWARGQGRPGESDIDLLCILRGPINYWQVLEATSELTARLSLAHEVVLSRVFVSEEEFVGSALPFFQNVRRESVAV